METYHLIVAEQFSRDHWNRGCMNIDVRWEELVIKRVAHRVTLALTEHQIKELHADADYYCTSGSYRTPEFFGFVASARAVRNAIRKQFPNFVN